MGKNQSPYPELGEHLPVRTERRNNKLHIRPLQIFVIRDGEFASCGFEATLTERRHVGDLDPHFHFYHVSTI